MKKKMTGLVIWIVTIVLLIVAGCDSGAVSGAVAGGAVAGALQALELESNQLQQELETTKAEWEKVKAGVNGTIDATEKAILERKISDLEERLANLSLIKTGVEGAGTDWNDPQAVNGYSQTAMMGIIAYLLRKRREELEPRASK